MTHATSGCLPTFERNAQMNYFLVEQLAQMRQRELPREALEHQRLRAVTGQGQILRPHVRHTEGSHAKQTVEAE